MTARSGAKANNSFIFNMISPYEFLLLVQLYIVIRKDFTYSFPPVSCIVSSEIWVIDIVGPSVLLVKLNSCRCRNDSLIYSIVNNLSPHNSSPFCTELYNCTKCYRTIFSLVKFCCVVYLKHERHGVCRDRITYVFDRP